MSHRTARVHLEFTFVLIETHGSFHNYSKIRDEFVNAHKCCVC